MVVVALVEVRLLLVVAAVAIIFDDLPPKVNLVMRYFVNSTTYSELVLECSDKKKVFHQSKSRDPSMIGQFLLP